MKKKLLAVLMSMILLLGVLTPVAALADTDGAEESAPAASTEAAVEVEGETRAEERAQMTATAEDAVEADADETDAEAPDEGMDATDEGADAAALEQEDTEDVTAEGADAADAEVPAPDTAEITQTVAATTAQEKFIDNTVDNSVSHVTGHVHITGSGGTQAGYNPGVTVYSEDASVIYSTPKTAKVQELIDAAWAQAEALAQDVKDRGKSGEFHMSMTTTTQRVWDNRTYTTISDGDAVLIGDADYLQGAYGVNDDYTVTHIASGDYGKETLYRVEANGWVAGFDISVEQTGSGTVESDLTSSLSGEKITVTLQADSGWVLDIAGVFSVSDDHQISARVYGDSGITQDTITFTMPKDDVEISVSFREAVKTYTVTVSDDGNGTGSASPAAGAEGTEVSLTATPNDGYAFKEWQVVSGGVTVTDDSFTIGTENVEIKAVFEWIPVYTVTVSDDGNGTGAASPASGAEGTEVTLTATPNDGYAFKAWQVISGGVTVTDDSFTIGTENVEVKAVFEALPSYTVSFQTDGAAEIPDQTVVSGKTAEKPADPVKEDYVFGGWYGDAAFTESFDFTAPITADTSLYAKWTEAAYVLTSVAGTTADGAHSWTQGSGVDAVITVKRNDGVDHSFAHFTGVQIDGTTLESGTDYSAREGSTVVTLKAATLQKLALGGHTVRILFDNGQVDTTLTVVAPPVRSSLSPKTGDSSALGLWGLVTVVSGLSLAALLPAGRARRKSR